MNPANEDQLDIPRSKKKLVLLLLGALGFVAAGIWFVTSPPKLNNPALGNPVLMFIVGIASIIFFGASAYFIARKLPGNDPGLTINQKGIFVYSTGMAGQFIPWNDIDSIGVLQMYRQKLITLQVGNPQQYIEKQASTFNRNAMAMNLSMYGTPLIINANDLKISFDVLMKTMQQYHQTYRQA